MALFLPDAPFLLVAAATAAGAVTTFLLTEKRPGRITLALALYLGLVDGSLRLLTGISSLTLLRDAAIAVAAGAMLVRATRGGAWPGVPPLTPWLALLTGLVLVAIFNPLQESPLRGIAAVRQHVEFIPFFFFGYLAVRTKGALRATLLVIVLLAAANGLVGYFQFTLTPAELSAWGPGYEKLILGTGPVTGRVFTDATGTLHVRPPALGSDLGFGANMGALAVAPLLALAFVLQGRRRLWLLPVGIAVVAVILTGQSRSAVIAGGISAVVYTGLVTSGRRTIVAMVGLLGGTIAAALVISAFTANFAPGLFDRYKSIGPSELTKTTQESRGGSIALLPEYMFDYPLGAGLGSGGPAAGFVRNTTRPGLDSETEFTFLVIELGIPGLVLLTAFVARVLALSLALRREVDPELRLLLAALTAAIVGLIATWFSGTPTATVPGGPYLWFAAGALAWWLHHGSARDRTTRVTG